MKARNHVVIAVPTYSGMVHIGTSRAIINDTVKMLGLGWAVTIEDTIGSADIYDSRAALVEKFLARLDATHLMMVDSDVQWPRGGIPRLVDHNVDFAAALYPQRKDPLTYALQYMHDDKVLRPDPSTGLIEMAGVSAGFICLTRGMIERMIEHYRDDPVAGCYERDGQRRVALWDPYRVPGTPRKMGEDYAFCQRWRDIGGKVWVDPDIPMAHVGLKVFQANFADWLKLMPAQEAA